MSGSDGDLTSSQKSEDRDRISGLISHEVSPTRAWLVCPEVRQRNSVHLSKGAREDEFRALASAIQLDIVDLSAPSVRDLKPATFIGGGQVEQLAEQGKAHDIDLFLFDCSLTPIQQRNLEKGLGAKVLDRTALILEIFGERAATREGVLQVELAHLNYQRSRLVRSWTHLERQRGGFGFIGGPGETQIEADRRQLRERIALLERRLEEVRRTRQLQRKPREAVPFPLVALVGYTNAGKSTLFNRLTGAGVMAKDMLFATLDTTVRKVQLPHGRDIIMSDTVGFIADLPTDLVAAFRATLEETIAADVILHVRDVSNPDHAKQAADVMSVLTELGVSPATHAMIEVWNKSDLVKADADSADPVPAEGTLAAHKVSALTGAGIDALLQSVENTLARDARTYDVTIPFTDGEGAAWLHRNTEVIERHQINDSEERLLVRVLPRNGEAFLSRFAGRSALKKAV